MLKINQITVKTFFSLYSRLSTSEDVEMAHLNERSLLATLAAVQFTHIVDFMIMMPLGPQLMRNFSIGPHEFSLLIAMYSLCGGAIGFIGAFWIDRFDRRKALAFCYCGFILGTLACAFAPDHISLLIARGLAGAFGGVSGTLVLSIVSDAIPYERRGTALGVVMASFSVASVFGVPFGLFLSNHWGWHAPFFFVAGVGLLVWISIFVSIPKMVSHMMTGRRSSPLEILSDIASHQEQREALMFMSILMLSQFIIIPFISPYLVANVGFPEENLPLVYLLGGGMTIITSPLVGRWSDRAGKIKVFTIFASLAFIPILLITNLGPTPMAIALMITTMFFVISNGRFVPAMALISATVSPQKRGSFMSINSAVQQLSSAIASYTAGIIITNGPKGELLNYSKAGILSAILSIMVIVLGRRLRAQKEN